MENNFIQMAASAGHEVAYTIGPIFNTYLWQPSATDNAFQKQGGKHQV